MDWKDNTSYSRGDEERIPRTWLLKHRGLSISVTRLWMTRDADGRYTNWYLNCHALAIKQYELESDDIADAQSEAVLYVAKKADAVCAIANEMAQWQAD